MLHRMGCLALALAFVCLGSPSFGQTAKIEFVSLGPVGVDNRVRGVSDNGLVVCGDFTRESKRKAFRWTAEAGFEFLDDLPGGDLGSGAADLSADGEVVVGGVLPLFPSGAEAFRWTKQDGMVALGHLPGMTPASSASGVSADGSVIVGASWSGGFIEEAFRWTEEDGMVGLGYLPGGGPLSRATDVSANGKVVVGRSSSARGTQAFRWTEEEGMVGLGYLGGRSFSAAHDVSADGKVVVGESSQAFRWTEEEGMVGLGLLPGTFNSAAFGVSANGAIVVGTSISSLSFRAFIWTERTGMVSLRDALVSAGVDLTGWTLDVAWDISADGRTIIGTGTRREIGEVRELWVVRLPPGVVLP